MEDVENNTIERNIMMAEKPKRQSLTHHDNPYIVAVATPMKLKKNQKPKQKRESPTIRLKSYTTSRLKTKIFTMLSTIKLAKNKETPRNKPLISPS